METGSRACEQHGSELEIKSVHSLLVLVES